ncbi:MAG TPA: response regulator transcription factor [Candidatus Acidoferrum sp.]|jgi:DNA-binding response OmpR family regulator|nr:response regulator transcription factor [Candidatus Acidoferrum sp.]
MRILVVEDDKKIASFVQNGLRQAGFAVDHAANGADGLHLALTVPYDAAVVDIMLPIRDGLSMIEQIRQHKINTPVIILSAKRTVDERVYGLQIGGDDYMIKPFAFSELLARIQGLIRRSTGAVEAARISAGNLSIDLLKREATLSGKMIDLQPREFSLLEFLVRNAGRIVSKTMILEHIWDYSFDPQTNVVDVLICRLRSKLDKEGVQKIIRTVRGAGYVLKA